MPQFDLSSERTALVNVDLQQVFVEACGSEGAAVVERVNRLAGACRKAGIPVIHTRHILPPYLGAGLLGEMFDVLSRGGGFLAPDTTTAAFHPALVTEPSDLFVEKPHFGAFHDTNLGLLLRRRGVDHIIISGIETNVCCETTAREALMRDIRVSFMSDGTTTGGVPGLTVAEVHRASLATIGRFFGEVMTVDEMISRIENA